MTFMHLVKERISELKSIKKKSFFSISSTAKIENEAYLTPVRICGDFILSGSVVFDKKDLLNLIEQIDGKVDFILADSERKNLYRIGKLGMNDSVIKGFPDDETISSICFKNFKKTKVVEFKPNDLTVNATWSFLSQRLRSLSGKRISILGAGNIGSKLALMLVECGAKIHFYRRDAYKGNKIIHGLNLIKPEGIANIQLHSDPMKASFMSDVLIGTTSGYSIIDEHVINNVKKNCLVVDLGKNNLTKNAIKIATKNSMEIYRTDVTPAIQSYVYEVLKTQDIIENSYGKKNLGFCNIVSGGFFGRSGDIVVDRINNPKRVIGVAKGDGVLKMKLNKNDKNNITKILNKFNLMQKEYHG